MTTLQIDNFTGNPTILHDLLNSEVIGFNKDGKSSFFGEGVTGEDAPYTIWIEYADDVDVADIQSVVDNYETLKP